MLPKVDLCLPNLPTHGFYQPFAVSLATIVMGLTAILLKMLFVIQRLNKPALLSKLALAVGDRGNIYLDSITA